MIVAATSDEALAARARRGDDRAFGELVRRYAAVIGAATRRPMPGLGWEDERQEALIGLFSACRAYRRGRGRFAALAAVCIRHRVWNARTRSQRPTHRILSDALALDHPTNGHGRPPAERISAGDHGGDPAVICELREELARLAVEGERRREPAPRRAPARPSRRYDDHERSTAVALVAEGKTLREAAAAIGATHTTVLRWLRNAA